MFFSAGTDSVAFLAPSVTPWFPGRMYGGTAINPSIRLYSYDTQSVLDYTQFHLNLTQANNLNLTQANNLNLTQANNLNLTQANNLNLTQANNGSTSHQELMGVTTASPVPSSAHLATTTPAPSAVPVPKDISSKSDSSGFMTLRDLKAVKSECDDKGSAPEGKDCHHIQMRNLKFALGRSDDPVASPVQWQVFYKAADAYSLPRLDAFNMNALWKRLESNDSLFAEYYLRNSAGVDNGPCHSTCKARQLCAIHNLRVKDLFSCMRFNRTYFTELLNQTFRNHNPEDYAPYFTDSVSVSPPAVITTTDNPYVPTVAITVPSDSGNHQISDSGNHRFTDSGNSSNPYVPTNANKNASSYLPHYGVPVLLMVSFAAVLWLAIAALFFVLRWRRMRSDRSPLSGLQMDRQGYAPLQTELH